MKVNVAYMAKARKVVGIANEIIELEDSCLAKDFIVNNICQRHKELADYLLDGESSIRDVFAIFVDDKKLEPNSTMSLEDDSEITIISPITGG